MPVPNALPPISVLQIFVAPTAVLPINQVIHVVAILLPLIHLPAQFLVAVGLSVLIAVVVTLYAALVRLVRPVVLKIVIV